MSSNKSLRVLDDAQENRKMVAKLPEWLINRWRRVIVGYKQEKKEFPPFSEFSKFVKQEAAIANEPTLTLADRKEINPTSKPARSMATNTVSQGKKQGKKEDHSKTEYQDFKEKTDEKGGKVVKPAQVSPTGTKPALVCVFCDREGHEISKCRGFRKEELNQRKAYAMKKRPMFRVPPRGPYGKTLQE